MKTADRSSASSALSEERIVPTTCGHNCGGRCVVKAHVRDGRIVRISTDQRAWNDEAPPLRACARGFSMIDRIYADDRLKYPQRRVGPRGAGRFERCTWDEALDEVAAQLRRVRDTYGPAAILDISRSGSTSMLHSRAPLRRLLHMFGGCTELWGSLSNEAEVFAARHTFGVEGWVKASGREGTDYPNSKLILLWGWAPADATFGTNTPQYLTRAKRAGTRFVSIDPRVSRTVRDYSDWHIPILPGTDTAMLLAMAYVILTEGLHDQAFLDRYCSGFDEAHLPPGAPAGSSFRTYLLGLADGQPKTPEWAAPVTSVPAATIRALAIEYATSKPAAIHTGYAPGRTAYGEQFHRAAYTLAAMTGNIGIPGGNCGSSGGAKMTKMGSLPSGVNPAKAAVNSLLMPDVILRGKAGGYPSDIHLIYSTAGDLFNQVANSNKILESLKRVDFIVVHDHFMTPTAQYADVVLPATTSFERNDVHVPWSANGHYALFMNKAIEPMYECKSDLEICTLLAERLGIEGYNTKTEEEWLREIVAVSEVEDFEEFRRTGVARLPAPRSAVAFSEQIADPEGHPFATPSGKIEIYSQTLAARPNLYGLGEIPAIPTYLDPWQRMHGAERRRYPLALFTPRSKVRTHSIHVNQPELERIEPHVVWVNVEDAAARGVVDGQMVRVFNDLGETRLRAHVTDRVMRGAVCMNEGGWLRVEGGVDLGGNPNAVSLDLPSPGGAASYNSNLVDVAPA